MLKYKSKVDILFLCILRLLNFCLTTSLEKDKEGNEQPCTLIRGCNKYRSTLRDHIVQYSSEVCLSKFLFLNIETVESVIEPLSWAIQNDSCLIKQVF